MMDKMGMEAFSTRPRLFVQADLVYDVPIAVSSGQAHYLGAVLRRQPGDEVRLFNGRDGEWLAVLTSLQHGRGQMRPMTVLRDQSVEPELTLAFAVLKRDATELIVQKATELGVTRLQPVVTERSQRHQVNAARMTAIAVEAAEQSERLAVPLLAPPCSLAELLSRWPTGRPLAVAVERSGPSWTPVQADALLIGPEGGFSPRELDAIRRHPFVLPVSLGPTILRAETAAIAGLTLLMVGLLVGLPVGLPVERPLGDGCSAS